MKTICPPSRLRTLPIVESLQDLPIVEQLASPTFDDELDFPDALAFLIGHKDGIVRGHQLTPIPINTNKFEALPTIDDKAFFSNNMQGLQRMEHKREISKQERKLDQEAQNFELLLFSDTAIFPPSTPSTPVHETSPPRKTQRQKHRRLNHLPITIPGTPSPDYSHRDTNYRPPLSECLLIDDLAFPTPKHPTHENTHRLPKTTLTSPPQASLTNSTELGEYRWLGNMKGERKTKTKQKKSKIQRDPSRSIKKHTRVTDLNSGSPMQNQPSDTS